MSTETIEIDFDDLALGDVQDFEDELGIDFEQFKTDPTGMAALQGQSKTKVLITLVWIMKRRTDPSFTLADARAIKVTALGTLKMKDGSTAPKAKRAARR